MKKETKKQQSSDAAVNRLRQLRDKKGLTQLAMQMRTGIDQSELSKMERGERLPTLEQAIILSHFFDTSIDYICNETDEPTPYPRAIKEKKK